MDARSRPNWALPDGSEIGDPLISTCYPHDTLVTAATACDPKTLHCDRPEVLGSLGWGYYGPSSAAWSQWNAPQANPQTCYGIPSRVPDPPYPSCGAGPGTEYGDHVHLSDKYGYSDAPIFDDLYGCKLPAISWVVPDGRWSDHTLSTDNQYSLALGPYWVGDIINAVGQQACGGKYWSGTEPTAVIVTWDDWGGWYDHIPPWAYYRGTCDQNEQNCKCPTTVAPNGWGCGYIAGFRVPLLVVSAYTGQSDGKGGVTGWFSGACGQPPLSKCPNMPPQFTHDFGSILGFTEWNFGMKNITYPDTSYADYNAPDWSPDRKTPPLADFFTLTTARQFVPVPTGKWTYNCFTKWGCPGTSGSYVPEDPDDY